MVVFGGGFIKPICCFIWSLILYIWLCRSENGRGPNVSLSFLRVSFWYIMSAGMDTSLSVNTGNDPAWGPWIWFFFFFFFFFSFSLFSLLPNTVLSLSCCPTIPLLFPFCEPHGRQCSHLALSQSNPWEASSSHALSGRGAGGFSVHDLQEGKNLKKEEEKRKENKITTNIKEKRCESIQDQKWVPIVMDLSFC